MTARLTHNQNRTGCVTHDAVRRMTLAKSSNKRRIAPAEDDQIGSASICALSDFEKRNPRANDRLAAFRWSTFRFAKPGKISLRCANRTVRVL